MGPVTSLVVNNASIDKEDYAWDPAKKTPNVLKCVRSAVLNGHIREGQCSLTCM